MVGFEIDFLPVGEGERSGDAIALRYGENGVYAIHVVDGGDQRAAEALVRHIRGHYGNPRYVDHVVLTHADDDHSSGLRAVIDNFDVGAIWMNRPWLYAADTIHLFRDTRYTLDGLTRRLRSNFPILAEIDQIAAQRGIPIYEVFQGAQIGAFTVLSPTRARYISLIPHLSRTPAPAEPHPVTGGIGGLGLLSQRIPQTRGIGGLLVEAARSAAEWVAETWERETLSEDETTTESNETSVVQFASFDGWTVLLTGDAGNISLHEAANYAEPRGAGLPGLWFMQMPHHGSRHNVSPSVLNRWIGTPLAQGQSRDTTAFVSVSAGDDKRPRRKVSNAYIRRGANIHATKGSTKRHRYNMPDRPGWVASMPLEFYERVEV